METNRCQGEVHFTCDEVPKFTRELRSHVHPVAGGVTWQQIEEEEPADSSHQRQPSPDITTADAQDQHEDDEVKYVGDYTEPVPDVLLTVQRLWCISSLVIFSKHLWPCSDSGLV